MGSLADGLRVFNNIPASKTGSLAETFTDSKGHSGFTKMGFVDGKGHSGFTPVAFFCAFTFLPAPKRHLRVSGLPDCGNSISKTFGVVKEIISYFLGISYGTGKPEGRGYGSRIHRFRRLH